MRRQFLLVPIVEQGVKMASEHLQGLVRLNDLEVEWLMVADFAQVVTDKLFLNGGGWDHLIVPSLPLDYRFSMVAAFRIPWNDTNIKHPIRIRVDHEDGSNLVEIGAELEIGRPPGIPAGSTQRAQTALDVSTVLQQSGAYRVTASIQDRSRSTSFLVVQAPMLTSGQPEARIGR